MVPVQFGEVAEQLRRSTVMIHSGGNGSGVVWNADGLIVTNAHVARARNLTVELWNGQRHPAELLASDLKRDLASIRIAAKGLEPAERCPAAGLRPGELVIAVGNPLGFHGALSTGVVHRVGPYPGMGRLPWVQAAVRLAPGNSGGPLADARGRVAGINTAVAQGLGLAVPVEAVERFLSKGPEGRQLGIAAQGTPQGVLILEVHAGSPAEAASLMQGDLLIDANERPLRRPEDLVEVIESSDSQLRLRFRRGDRERVREVAVRL
jgi:serine protease Do